MQAFQLDPLIPLAEIRTKNLRKAWSIVMTHARPRRLLQEDEGVRGPLWVWSNPNVGALHIVANVFRIIIALLTAPAWMWLSPTIGATFKYLLQAIVWGHEWSQIPEAVLLSDDKGKVGEYAVAGWEPRWLLEVQFQGVEIVKKTQVHYGHVKKRIQDAGYTAIGYPIKSADQLLKESDAHLDPQSGVPLGKHSLSNRKRLAHAILDEYARARTTILKGKTDGIEYLWIDEFCLSEEGSVNEAERDAEMGQHADIFRSAKRVVVFCHIVGCDHTGVECPWGNRLFALGEIMHASRVLKMKQTYESDEDQTAISSVIAATSGQDFRAEIQARAAEAKQWNLYTIMQHATNSGGVTWQSAIHSLVVEALRRGKLDDSTSPSCVGRALNGLFPRRSQLGDLRGIDGWADLIWLLELNQGYYNAAMLASVCKLADPDTNKYRWWGEPITPKEGSERLEPLATGIPVKFHDKFSNSTVPALSLLNARAIALDHMLQRDSGALERQPEMKSLKLWARLVWSVLVVLGFILASVIGGAGAIILYVASILYVILQLIVGTIYVNKDRWVVIEDHKAPGADAFRFLRAQDPSFSRGVEWGSKQLTPRWDVRHLMEPRTSREAAHPYPVTLIDLRTGVLVKTFVTTTPNDMAVLAVHGNGITSMLLDRDTKTPTATICVKVGMASLPPYVLAQALPTGSLYVGGSAFRVVRPPIPFWTWVYQTITGQSPEETKKELTEDTSERSGKVIEDLEMQDVSLNGGLDMGAPLEQTASIASSAPILPKTGQRYRAGTVSSGTTVTGNASDIRKSVESDLGNGPVPPLPNSRYRAMPNVQWFPERRGAENV